MPGLHADKQLAEQDRRSVAQFLRSQRAATSGAMDRTAMPFVVEQALATLGMRPLNNSPNEPIDLHDSASIVLSRHTSHEDGRK
jgi:hypothetical protein